MALKFNQKPLEPVQDDQIRAYNITHPRTKKSTLSKAEKRQRSFIRHPIQNYRRSRQNIRDMAVNEANDIINGQRPMNNDDQTKAQLKGILVIGGILLILFGLVELLALLH